MSNLEASRNELTDCELDQVHGGAIGYVVAGALMAATSILAGYGAVRLVQDVTETGTLKPLPRC